MVELEIGKNDGGQRLDRFLKKYYSKAPLSMIYRMIRKDVKVNGKRGREDLLLNTGDILTVYIDKDKSEALQEKRKRGRIAKQFRVAYEDRDIIIVEKPFGLLTHGDSHEKKNTLANQVEGYLIAEGSYDPRAEKTFSPAPVNRLDRNTTGLVIFGKNAEALREMNRMIRERAAVSKYYLTIVAGRMDSPLALRDRMTKDSRRNVVSITSDEDGKLMETVARPLETSDRFTLAEVELLTGRTHQIRTHLASAGYPVIGDIKYGNREVNREMKQKFGLTTQLLHAWKLVFREGPLAGTEVESELPERFAGIKNELFGRK